MCFSLASQRIVQKAKFALAQFRPLRPHSLIPAIQVRCPTCFPESGTSLLGAWAAPAFPDSWTCRVKFSRSQLFN